MPRFKSQEESEIYSRVLRDTKDRGAAQAALDRFRGESAGRAAAPTDQVVESSEADPSESSTGTSTEVEAQVAGSMPEVIEEVDIDPVDIATMVTGMQPELPDAGGGD